METVANALTLIVAGLELWFLILEMFLWKTPRIAKAFNLTPQFAEDSAVLAKNQGLYNGFLAAGLVWGVIHPSLQFAFQLKLFFLGCVLIAGLYGAATASRRILFVQALPAAIAILFTCIAYG